MMTHIAKLLFFSGAVLIILGTVFFLFGKLPFFGKLPGDIYIEKKNFTFYFPLATSLFLSAIGTFILWIFSKR